MVSIFAINGLFDVLQEMLKELFPSWKAVRRYREVVLFVAGLMKDSRPLVQFVYEMQVEDYLNKMRTGDRYSLSIAADLFKSLQAESSVRLVDDPLHNKYINYYNHDEDERKERPFDITAIDRPCKIYNFTVMEEDVVLGDYKAQSTEIPECVMDIHCPNVTVTKSLLSKCRTISEHQAVTDLRMQYVDCDDVTKAEAPFLSRNIRSLCIAYCQLPSSCIRNILQQLHDCVTLINLQLVFVDLREVEEDLDKLLDNLVSNHEKGLSQENLEIWMDRNGLSEEFAAKWNDHCEGITSIDCRILYNDDDDDDEDDDGDDDDESGSDADNNDQD